MWNRAIHSLRSATVSALRLHLRNDCPDVKPATVIGGMSMICHPLACPYSAKVETEELYTADDKILTAGDGNFSFSHALAVYIGDASNLTATSLNSLDELRRMYKDALKHIACIIKLGGNVVLSL